MSPYELGLIKLEQAGIQPFAPDWVRQEAGNQPIWNDYTKTPSGQYMQTGLYNSLLGLQGGGPEDFLSGKSSFTNPTVSPGGLQNSINSLVAATMAAPPVYQTQQQFLASPDGQGQALADAAAYQAFTSGGN
jgi:hypothetical protein